jgi:uncharacterized protein YkwD
MISLTRSFVTVLLLSALPFLSVAEAKKKCHYVKKNVTPKDKAPIQDSTKAQVSSRRGYRQYSSKAPPPKPAESPKMPGYEFEAVWENPEPAKKQSPLPPVQAPKIQPKVEEPKPKPQEQVPRVNPGNGFDSDCLSTHNRFRSIEGVQSLSWDEGLAREARDHAREMAQRRRMEHRGSGENLYQAFGNGLSCTSAVTAWYDEKKDYTPGTKIGEGDFSSYGHYTQVSFN